MILRQKGLLRVLIFAAVVAMLPNSVLFPAAKDISAHLHTPISFIGLMVSMYSIAYLVITPILGVISDRVSRKWILVTGLTLFALGGVFPLVTHTKWLILLGRALMGVGSAGIMPTVYSIIGDEYSTGETRRQALTWIGIAIAFAEALLPFFSGVVDSLSWRGVFVLYITGILAAFSALWIKPAKSQGDHVTMQEYAKGIQEILRHKLLFATMLSTVLFAMVYFGVSALLPLALAGHANGFWYGVLFLPLGVSWVLVNAWMIRRAGTHHISRYAILASIVLAVATTLLAFSHQLWPLLAVSLLWGLGSGVLDTIFTWVIGDETPEAVRGIVNGLFNASFILGFALGAPLFLWLKSLFGLAPAALCGAVIMLLAGGLEWMNKPNRKRFHFS